MTEGITGALAIARAEFGRRLTAVTDDDWGRPTPCTEWNVRQLASHIVSHEYRYAGNLATNNWAIRRSSPDRLADVAAVLARLARFEIDAAVRATAAAYTDPGLRALDAIHLARQTSCACQARR